jgi:hypothetical protein
VADVAQVADRVVQLDDVAVFLQLLALLAVVVRPDAPDEHAGGFELARPWRTRGGQPPETLFVTGVVMADRYDVRRRAAML